MSELGNKQVFAKNLQWYMDKENIDRYKLCEDLNFKYSTVSEWLAAKKYPRIDKIEILANYFHILKSDLIEEEKSDYKTIPFKNYDLSQYENISPVKLKRFPMLGEIAYGQPIWSEEDRDSYVMADMDINADFCLTAKGDSMINARINDGDIVFIKEMPMVDNGDIAAVIIDDDATLKRVYYYPEDNTIQLIAENPKFKPLIYKNEELDQIRILGKAVYFMSAL